MAEEVLTWIFVISYLDICWLHWNPQNNGCCCRGLKRHQNESHWEIEAPQTPWAPRPVPGRPIGK